MQPTPPSIPKKSRRWIWIPLAAALLAGFVGIFIYRAHEKHRRDQAAIVAGLAKIRAAGEPVTAQDLAKLYPSPPPEHDAAILLAPALAALSIPDDVDDLPLFGSRPFPSATKPLPEKTRSKIEELLAENERAMKLVPRASLNRSSVDSGFENGFPLSSYNPRGLLNLTRLFCLAAIVDARKDGGSNCIQQIRDALLIGDTLRGGVLNHFLVHRVIQLHACEVLEWVLNRGATISAETTPLQTLLSEEDQNGIRDALISFRCQSIWGLEYTRTNLEQVARQAYPNDPNWLGSVKSYVRAKMRVWSGRIYRDQDLIDYLNKSAEVIAALQQPPDKCLARLNEIRDEANKAYYNAYSKQTFAAILSSGFLKIAPRVVQDLEIRARLRTARAALIIESWRNGHAGSLPDSLDSLPAEDRSKIPVDPFDLQPLRYKMLKKGFVVYSVGPDFNDDGGKQKPADAKETDRFDITFTVAR